MSKGIFTSNRGEGDEPLWRIKHGTRVPLQVVPLLGAIVVCFGWTIMTNFGGVDKVPLLDAIAIIVSYKGGRRVMANFGGVGMVPLLGAITGCHSSVVWGNDQLWGSGRGVITGGCHCRVPISILYSFFIFRVTNFTQIPKKTAKDFVFSFTSNCCLH